MQSNDIQPGRWDIPSRILIGTTFIILLTEMAPLLGSRLTGLLATIPLYTAILTVFSHRLQGAAGAATFCAVCFLDYSASQDSSSRCPC